MMCVTMGELRMNLVSNVRSLLIGLKAISIDSLGDLFLHLVEPELNELHEMHNDALVRIATLTKLLDYERATVHTLEQEVEALALRVIDVEIDRAVDIDHREWKAGKDGDGSCWKGLEGCWCCSDYHWKVLGQRQ